MTPSISVPIAGRYLVPPPLVSIERLAEMRAEKRAPRGDLSTPEDTTVDVVSNFGRSAIALASEICTKYVLPSLDGAQTRAEYQTFLGQHWADYSETLWTLRSMLFRASVAGVPVATEAQTATLKSQLVEGIERVAGRARADEVDFALQTVERATRLTRRFKQLPAPRDLAEDRMHATEFNDSGAMYVLSLASLQVYVTGRAVAADVLEQVFDYLQASAMQCYQHARLALDLRQAEEPLPDAEMFDHLDDEDRALADADRAETERLLREAEQE